MDRASRWAPVHSFPYHSPHILFTGLVPELFMIANIHFLRYSDGPEIYLDLEIAYTRGPWTFSTPPPPAIATLLLMCSHQLSIACVAKLLAVVLILYRTEFPAFTRSFFSFFARCLIVNLMSVFLCNENGHYCIFVTLWLL